MKQITAVDTEESGLLHFFMFIHVYMYTDIDIDIQIFNVRNNIFDESPVLLNEIKMYLWIL